MVEHANIVQTVTFFWDLSDFLRGRNKSMPITSEILQESGVSNLVTKASQPDHTGANAALWMLLLLRLTAVTSDDRLELRNSKSYSTYLGTLNY